MEPGYSVPLVLVGALLVAIGVALLAFAPQARGLAARLVRAARARERPSSPAGARGVQAAGALLVLLGAAILLWAARPT